MPDPAETTRPAGLTQLSAGSLSRPFGLRRARRHGAGLDRREVLVATALAASLLAALALALSAAAGSGFLVPSAHQAFPDWLSGPLPNLGFDSPRAVEVVLVVLLGAGWAATLALPGTLVRAAAAAVVALHVIMLLAPPLFTTDVFGYLAFARLDVVHGLAPYSDAVQQIPQDPVHTFLSDIWPTELSSPYGPLFLLGIYPLAPLGLPAGLWGLKLITAASALGSVALVAASARRLGMDSVRAAVFVGLNPLWLAWVVAGAHNDLPMVVLAVAGVHLLVVGYDRWGGAALTAAVAVKATAGLVALYMLAGARRPARVVTGIVLAGVALSAVFLASFGTDVLNYPAALLEQGRHVSGQNVPRNLIELFGLGEVTPTVKAICAALLLATVAALLVAVRRGMDALTAAGWATIAFLLTTTSLHVWYVAILLPLAALSPSHRLRVATVAMTVLLPLVELT